MFLITRHDNSTVNGVKHDRRVYVTGPHFGADVYSSTIDREKATRYDKPTAEKLVRTKPWNMARIEEESA